MEMLSVTSQSARNILIGVCGTEGAAKFVDICNAFKVVGNVKVIATEPSKKFFSKMLVAKEVAVYTDDDDWNPTVGNSLHLELAQWANAMVILPASANTIAKMAAGICDNLLTCVVKSWDYQKLLVVGPDMDLRMWNNPSTQANVAKLRGYGAIVVNPAGGRMVDPAAIISLVNNGVFYG